MGIAREEGMHAEKKQGPSQGDGSGKGETLCTTTLKGVVIPVDWDEEGNVTGAAVSTYDEDEYFIEGRGEGVRLMADMRKRVQVQGTVREEGGRKIITVKHYSLGTAE
jgi:hypothetical protein